MPAKLNKEWHLANPMPKPATLDGRLRWHLEHNKQCGCREIPASLVVEIEKRGGTIDKLQHRVP